MIKKRFVDSTPAFAHMRHSLPRHSVSIIVVVLILCVHHTLPFCSCQAQFVTEQLLQLALVLDYADEAGRNKIACLLTDVFSLSMVPEVGAQHISVFLVSCNTYYIFL